MGCARRSYQPRHAEASVLHGVIRDHLDDFLRAADRADGAGLPAFIAREFREFLTCGVLAHGFARVRCERCALERLVPFSCEGRGFCPSCGGRRMTERAAHLVDEVVPPVPVRQWVLTLRPTRRVGRVALGARAGASVRRLGEGPRQARGGARGPRHAHREGFDLHANVWVGAHDRAGCSQRCRQPGWRRAGGAAARRRSSGFGSRREHDSGAAPAQRALEDLVHAASIK